MSNMEKENFEDSLKHAFDKAEINPSEMVWTNIELDLEKAEGGKMRRSLLFFKMLTAASVVFALGVGSSVFYLWQQSDQNLISQTNKEVAKNSTDIQPNSSIGNQKTRNTNSTSEAVEATDAHHSDTEISRVEDSALKNSDDKNISNAHQKNRDGFDHRAGDTESLTNEKEKRNAGYVFSNQYSLREEAKISEPSVVNNSSYTQTNTQFVDEHATLTRTNGALPALVKHQKPGIILPKQNETDPVAQMMARLEKEEQQVKEAAAKKKKNSKNAKDEKLWTSVGFAAGSFSAVSSGISSQTSNTILARNSQIADNEADASGTAYSVGVNMGTRISKRWVLQGGVNYMSQSSDYTAQTAVGSADFQSFRPASIEEFNKLNEAEGANQDKLVATAPYNVNNNVQYLSLPVQAGYMIIDKKFGLQLNAGIATDLFLQNTKSADDQNFDKVTQGRGSDSPYRPLNFAGLAGTELSYKFGSRYRLSLNPGLRYPFRSIYKSEAGVQSTPLIFDVGLRFRYIFH
jgi:hypothetical protein